MGDRFEKLQFQFQFQFQIFLGLGLGLALDLDDGFGYVSKSKEVAPSKMSTSSVGQTLVCRHVGWPCW